MQGDRNSSATPVSFLLFLFHIQPTLSRGKGRRELSSHRVNSAPDMRNWDLSWVDDRRHALKQGQRGTIEYSWSGKREGEERERDDGGSILKLQVPVRWKCG